jgi:hypothetical protein
MNDQWIIVPNWHRFQHYKDREPVWIKIYTELNSRDDWWQLSDAQRGLLVTIWIEYARSRGRLSVRHMSRHMRTNGARWGARRRNLERLNDAGWIEFSASKPLALRYHREEVLRTSSEEGASARAQTSEARASAAEKTRAACESLVRNLGHEMPKPALEEELHQLGADDDLVRELLAKL